VVREAVEAFLLADLTRFAAVADDDLLERVRRTLPARGASVAGPVEVLVDTGDRQVLDVPTSLGPMTAVARFEAGRWVVTGLEFRR
jgi:hypothetical protein